MGKLVRFEVKELPRLYVVGKLITYNMDEHMLQNRIPEFWAECMEAESMKPLWAQQAFQYDTATVGWMADWQNGDGTFSYVIGCLMKEGFQLPDDSYVAREIGPLPCYVGWITGKDTMDVCKDAHELTIKAAADNGHTYNQDIPWCMEYYHEERFDKPDGDGLITLDYYIPKL